MKQTVMNAMTLMGRAGGRSEVAEKRTGRLIYLKKDEGYLEKSTLDQRRFDLIFHRRKKGILELTFERGSRKVPERWLRSRRSAWRKTRRFGCISWTLE